MKNLATGLIAATGNKELPDNTWDLDYAERDLAQPWDISTLAYVGFQGIGAYDATPQAIQFNPDGTKMYITGTGSDDVHYWTLSTPWDPTTLTYAGYLWVGNYEGTPTGMTFDPDGERFYIIGTTGDEVNQYSLTTAWDLSTASYVRTSSSLSSIEGGPMGIFFKPDGTKMYMIGNVNDSVHEFALTTAWDVSTLSHNSNSTLDVSSYETGPTDLFFKEDGLKLYVVGLSGDTIDQYALTTAWDLSTASYDFKTFSISSQEASPRGMYIRSDGGMVFITGSTGDGVDTYIMGTNQSPFIGTYACGLYFKSDGTKVYVAENSGDRIKEYDLSTAWEPYTATYNQDFDIGGYEIYVRDVFFKPDGTKMYTLGTAGDDINEFNLSTAWSVNQNNVTYVQRFSVSGKDTAPTGMFFKSDGLTVWITGSGSDSVHEYSLSTAWDISTMSFEQSFSVSSEDTGPSNIHFKSDGTRMYIAGGANDTIYQYELTTAWDISTASYSKELDLTNVENSLTGLWWKPDGSRMYITGYLNDAILAFNVGD